MKKRKVVLYIAMSLDGYIADKDGGVDWLKGHEDKEHDEKGYLDFTKTIDTVIMGYTTYHQIVTELSKDKWYYEGLTSYILTHQKRADKKDIYFVNESLNDLIHKLMKEDGKDIWICGGADVVQQCLKEDLIDEFQIAVIPTILGQGVQMFTTLNQPIPLYLDSIHEANGLVELVYHKR